MDHGELLLSILGSSKGPIDGRTAIQKIAYFAALKSGIDLGYKPHFYGPYSADVSVLMGYYAATGCISERVKSTVRDRIMYSYSLTEDGIKLVEEIKKREASTYSDVARVVDRCQKIVKNNIYVLSWAAKVHFLLSQKGNKISYHEVIEGGKQLGWKLSNEDIDSAAKLLVGLGLVKSKAG